MCPSVGVTDKPQTLLSVSPSVPLSIVSVMLCPHYAARADTEGEGKVTGISKRCRETNTRVCTLANTLTHADKIQINNFIPLYLVRIREKCLKLNYRSQD